MHVLCNNAGVFQGGLIWECSRDDFEWTLGVNLWGILHAIRAFVPRMIEQGEPGHIVNTVSMAGLATTAYCAPYEVSKFAAAAATECLAHDLAASGAPITASLLCPGSVDTGIARSRRNRPPRYEAELSPGASFVEEALAGTTAGGAHPDDVADLVVEAIHDATFLVPTTPSFERQILDRAGAARETRAAAVGNLRLNVALAFPVRVALVEKGADAFLRVVVTGVRGHRGARQRVRSAFVDVDLLVERVLPEPDHARAELQDLRDEGVDGRVQLIWRHDVVHEPPRERGRRVDRLAGEEHLQSRIADR